jgi:hypothetical protein
MGSEFGFGLQLHYIRMRYQHKRAFGMDLGLDLGLDLGRPCGMASWSTILMIRDRESLNCQVDRNSTLAEEGRLFRIESL